MIQNWEIMMNEFLGGDFAQSIIAEIGQENVELIWMSGYSAMQEHTVIVMREQGERLAQIRKAFDALKKEGAA